MTYDTNTPENDPNDIDDPDDMDLWFDDPDDDYDSLPDSPWYSPEYEDLPECVMCGKERHVNSQGYCGSCWTIWNS